MNWKLTLTTAALVLGAALAVYGIAADVPGPILMPEIVVSAPRPEVILLPEKVITATRGGEPEPGLMPEVVVRAPRPEIVFLDTVEIKARRHIEHERIQGAGETYSVRRIHVRIRTAHAGSGPDHELPVPGMGLRSASSCPARDLGLCD